MDTGEGDFYLPRAGWTPQRGVWVQRLNRDQDVLDLMVFDPSPGTTRTLLTDRDDAWINIRDDLQLSRRWPKFLWTSERDGWRHLYLYGADGSLQRKLTSGEWQIEKVYGVDASENSVFFQANLSDHRHDTSTVSLSTAARSRFSATSRGGSTTGSLSPDGALLVDHWSTRDTSPRADLLAADGQSPPPTVGVGR